MRCVIQRVNQAQVKVKPNYQAAIGPGLLVLVGFGRQDTQPDLAQAANKIINMRLFPDKHKPINASLVDIQGELLVIPQFTLYAQIDKGHRPFFGQALDPSSARRLFDDFVDTLAQHYRADKVKTGRFGAYMEISADLTGPVTIIADW